MDERMVNAVHGAIAMEGRPSDARLRQVLRGLGERDGSRQAVVIAEARRRMRAGQMPSDPPRRKMWA